MRRHALLHLLTVLPLAAQTITFAEGTPGALTIVTVAEANPNGPDTVVLANVELLPLETTGRTLAQALDPTVSRRIERNGVQRVELPGGGRLFRYRRAAGTGTFYGFLHIAADGAARVVLERPALPGPSPDPFFDRFAVAADGQHAAIALANGGMFVVRLDGGVFASTGTPARQVVPNGGDVVPASVLVGPVAVFFQLDPGPVQVMRCDLADGALPVDVSAPVQANAITKDEMAISGDGSRCVFLYGPQQQQRLWQVGLTGSATVLPPLASKYEEPAYLPEGPGEPAMLLNHAGTRLFFIDSDVRDELSLLDLTGTLPPLQITESTIFQPYIGSHILPKFAADRLTVAIGDPAAMDWFRVELAPLGGTVINLTGTGSLAQPFPSGTLAPVDAASVNGSLLVVEQGATSVNLRRIDPLTGAQAVVQQDLLGAPELGSSNGVPADLLVHGSAGEALYAGSSGALMGVLPPGLALTPPAQGPLFAATWVALPNQWGAAAFYLPDGTVVMGPFEFDLKQLALTLQGGVVMVGSPLRYLAPGAYTVLTRAAVPFRLCLSGAGV
ncbi:MAG: hypothetical protein JNK15_20965 [Planctomycetes bacterium]|nr:hypothetical protein [Planctomycetota bacterium]